MISNQTCDLSIEYLNYRIDFNIQDFRQKCKHTKNKTDIVYELKGFHGIEKDLFKHLLRKATKQELDIKSCVSIPEKKRFSGLVSALVGSATGEADDDETNFLISQCEDKNSSQSQPIHFLIVEVFCIFAFDLSLYF